MSELPDALGVMQEARQKLVRAVVLWTLLGVPALSAFVVLAPMAIYREADPAVASCMMSPPNPWIEALGAGDRREACRVELGR